MCSASSPDTKRRKTKIAFARSVVAAGVAALVWLATPAAANDEYDAVAWQAELVSDIQPGPESGPSHIFVAPSFRVFAVADDGVYGSELWQIDGSLAETTLIEDIWPGAESGVSSLGASFAELGTTLFFSADDGVFGKEPWVTDGTAAGTMLLQDIRADSYSLPTHFTHHGGAVYFVANDRTHGIELWKSEGSEHGAVLVKNINTYRDPWMIDYDSGSKPSALLSYGPYLYFLADDNINGRGLWRTDGTEDGTILLKHFDDIEGSYNGFRTFVTDLAPVGPLLFTVAHGEVLELWKTNGTEQGTTLIKSFPKYIGDRYPAPHWIYFRGVKNGIVYFLVDDDLHGEELWRTDGNSAGTYLVKDINPDGDAFNQNPIAWVGSNMYFVPRHRDCGSFPNLYVVCDIWRSDGTSAGTVRITNFGSYQTDGPIPPDPIPIPGPYHPHALGDTLLFYRAKELWKMPAPGVGDRPAFAFVFNFGNPGEDPTSLLAHTKIWPDTVVGDKLIMRRGVPMPDSPIDSYQELWLTDSTSGGTWRVFTSHDMLSGEWNRSEIVPSSLKSNLVGNNVYFRAWQRFDAPTDDVGTEIYKLEVPLGNPRPALTLHAANPVPEGSPLEQTGFFRDWGTNSWVARADFGDGSGTQEVTVDANTVSASHGDADSGQYVVELCVTGGDGGEGCSVSSTSVINVVPTVGSITAPVDPLAVGTIVNASSSFTDPGTSDTHTAVWNWGDGTSSPGVVTESSGSGSVTGSHAYAGAGIYTVELTVTDKDGGVGTSQFQYAVVFDPDGGFVTGSGAIASPFGAYRPDPTLAGPARFGFVSRYRRGANIPLGNTQFKFHAAGLNFHSSAYQWLVVAGARAQFKGTGTLNGAPGYGFLLTAVDGQVNGGGGFDKFRIKIWNADGDVVYDNQYGANDDAALTTALQNGSIVVQTGKNKES